MTTPSQAADLLAAAEYLEGDGVSMPPVEAERIAGTLRGMAATDTPPADAFTVNFVRLAGLSKDKARECEEIVRTVLAARGVGLPDGGQRDA